MTCILGCACYTGSPAWSSASATARNASYAQNPALTGPSGDMNLGLGD